jgi:2-amino-4-hydroxy-6-hydroxymethyldihydropteridine diphosphokinase
MTKGDIAHNMAWEDVFIGFGSNMGEPQHHVCEALSRLLSLPGVAPVRLSSLYRTEPVGFEAQDWFINGVVWIKTRLNPRYLMGALLEIEVQMGRVRKISDGPRVIDLDVLMFGNKVIELNNLRVPHPKLHERRFVLVPLSEVAPNIQHPVIHKTFRELLSALRDPKKVIRVENSGEFQWVGSGGQS